jgi:hypothetical protein
VSDSVLDPEKVPAREALRLILEERADAQLEDSLQAEEDELLEGLDPEGRLRRWYP